MKLMCTFYLDDALYALDAAKVVEILRHQPLRAVALAAPEVSGLINLRGQIVVAIDLRRVLGLAPRAPEFPSMNVLAKLDDSTVSLLVDRIGDVVEVDPAQLLPAPENLAASLRPFVVGTYPLDAQLVLVVDPEPGAHA